MDYFKRTLSLILLLGTLFGALGYVNAQSPDSFKYQAVARDNNGNILANQNVGFKLTILENGPNGIVVYSETHTTSTNQYGLANLQVGGGTVVSGAFSNIDWGNNSHYLKVEMDPAGGSNYQFMGTSQLLSVPYALHAESVSNVADEDADTTNEIQDLTLNSNMLSITNNPSASSLDLSGYLDNTDSQTLSLTGNDLSISNGNTVTLPSVDGCAGCLDIGTEVNGVGVTARLTGDGSSGSPLDLASQGAGSGDVLKWNGSSWAPAADDYEPLPSATSGQTMRYDGSNWVANGLLYNDGSVVGINTTTPSSIYNAPLVLEGKNGQSLDIDTDPGSASEAIAIHSFATNSSSTNNYSYWGSARNASNKNESFHSPGGSGVGYFGDGTAGGTKNFLIDHPADPENKILRHTSVESNEALCIYRGKVELDQSGKGNVDLPDYFKPLVDEQNATVNLTSIGRPFDVGYEFRGDHGSFTVYGKPGREVSYVVMADRDDPTIQKLRKPVVQDKEKAGYHKGRYLHPDAFDKPIQLHEDWDVMRKKMDKEE